MGSAVWIGPPLSVSLLRRLVPFGPSIGFFQTHEAGSEYLSDWAAYISLSLPPSRV